MMKFVLAFTFFVAAAPAVSQSSAPWGAPAAPAIPEARGYVAIPNAAVTPNKRRAYRAIYNATIAPKEPSQLVPALSMVGGALNAFAASGVPLSKAKFAVIFHGPAIDGILNDAHFKAKHGIANPNLKVLSQLKKAGVKVFVCGQYLVRENIDPKNISSDVTVASAAQIVLMQYQNDGYALLSF